MQQRLDVKTMLNAFKLIRAHGVRQGGAWQLGGLRAWSDHAGNRVVVMNNTVKVSVTFHNMLQFDYRYPEQLPPFLAELGVLHADYATAAIDSSHQ